MSYIYISPAFKLADDIKERGWLVGDSLLPFYDQGIDPEKDKVGIFREVKNTVVPVLFGLFNRTIRHRDPMIACVWLNNCHRGASEDKKWVVEVHGTHNLERIEQLMEKVCSADDYEIRLSSTEEYIYEHVDY